MLSRYSEIIYIYTTPFRATVLLLLLAIFQTESDNFYILRPGDDIDQLSRDVFDWIILKVIFKKMSGLAHVSKIIDIIQ